MVWKEKSSHSICNCLKNKMTSHEPVLFDWKTCRFMYTASKLQNVRKVPSVHFSLLSPSEQCPAVIPSRFHRTTFLLPTWSGGVVALAAAKQKTRSPNKAPGWIRVIRKRRNPRLTVVLATRTVIVYLALALITTTPIFYYYYLVQ